MAAIALSGATTSVVEVQKKVFYRTDDESSGAKCLRSLMCGCCLPRYTITTEAIRTERWSGCSRVTESIDVDNIADLSLSQSCGLGYCLFGKGHLLLYVHENGKDRTASVKYVEKSEDVFREFSSHVHKVNNLKMGLKRPELKDMPHLVYDSRGDSLGIKCWRSVVCCRCCFFPRTVVTKEHITTTRWTLCGKKEIKQFDLDRITDAKLTSGCIESCCCSTGTIVIEGKDKDENGLVLKFVGNANDVYKKLDDYINILNNRTRVLGSDAMKR